MGFEQSVILPGGNPKSVSPGTYYCYNYGRGCKYSVTIRYPCEKLNPCPKCGSTVFLKT